MQENILSFDITGIQSCQRNRYPMLFIDKITECVPLKYAKGVKLFSYNEWYFPAHFSDNPNVPGAVLIESMTQVFLMTFLCTEKCRGLGTMSNKFANVHFYKKIIPGDKLEIEAVCDSYKRGVARGKAEGRIRGELACSLECTIIVPEAFGLFQRNTPNTGASLFAAEEISENGLCFDLSGIQKCMKNRHPWLFLDRVVDVKPGYSAVGVKNFTYNEWFFPQHFPEDPNVPGFVQIESCLQAFLMTFLSKQEYQGFETADRTLDNVKLARKIIPGDTLKIEAVLNSFVRGIAKGCVESFVNGEPATSFDVVVVVPDELNKFKPRLEGQPT